MNCGHSREMLALFIEDDLPAAQMAEVRKQVNGCADCRRFCEQLQASQSLIKDRLRAPLQASPAPEMLTAIRENVLSEIHNQWFFFRAPRYAFAGVIVLMIISAALLGQVRRGPASAPYDGKDALLRPQGYREWVLVGSNVYVDPAAYQEHSRTGRFPEGTVIVRERLRPGSSQEADPHGSLVVAMKDSGRFEGAWGFFDFSNATKAQPISDGTCRHCHSAGMDIG